MKQLVNFYCTVHPKKSDKWWPTCLSFDLEALNPTDAKARAWSLAVRHGMLSPRIVKTIKRPKPAKVEPE